MKHLYFIVCVLTSLPTLSYGQRQVNVEAGILLHQPRVRSNTTSTTNVTGNMLIQPNYFPALKTGFYINAMYSPDLVFSHVFRYANTSFGGTHKFAVESREVGIPSVAPPQHSFNTFGHQISYEIRTDIHNFMDAYVRKKDINTQRKLNLFFALGIGGTILTTRNFGIQNQAQVITPVSFNGNQGFTRSTYYSINIPFQINFPVELGMKYRINKLFYATGSYMVILPNLFSANRTQFLQSADYIFNNQLVAATSTEGPAITHGLRLGIGINLASWKHNAK